MEFDPIVKFLQGKTILVTGATGFMSKVFVEKILRLQPWGFQYLRAQDEESALQRLNDEVRCCIGHQYIWSSQCFELWKEMS
ncbi:hypothetical protein GQ457_12G027480 [Hibiscus cannabinus]